MGSFSKQEYSEDQNKFLVAVANAINAEITANPNGASVFATAAYFGTWLGQCAKQLPPEDVADIRKTILMNFDEGSLPSGILG